MKIQSLQSSQKHLHFNPGYEFRHLSDEYFNRTSLHFCLCSHPGVDTGDSRATPFAAKAHNSNEIPGLVLLSLQILLCRLEYEEKVKGRRVYFVCLV